MRPGSWARTPAWKRDSRRARPSAPRPAAGRCVRRGRGSGRRSRPVIRIRAPASCMVCCAVDGFSSTAGQYSLRTVIPGGREKPGVAAPPPACGGPAPRRPSSRRGVQVSRTRERLFLAPHDRYRQASSLSGRKRDREIGKKVPIPAGRTPTGEPGVMTTITADAAGTWQLGDHPVNRMDFGAMRLMSKADGSPSDRDTAIAVLRKAVELGVNHIDTAAFYCSVAVGQRTGHHVPRALPGRPGDRHEGRPPVAGRGVRAEPVRADPREDERGGRGPAPVRGGSPPVGHERVNTG